MMISLSRTIILYLFVIFSIRLMGKRQIGELQPSELVVTILVSELATLPMQDFDLPILLGIIPIVTLVFFEHIVSFICMKNVKIRRFINGNPCIIIKDGKLDIKTLTSLRISVDEVLEELRVNNVTEIEDVKYAIIETNGQLSYILYPHARNVTSGMLNINSPDSSLPLVVVNDGYILEHNLSDLKKNREWLLNYLYENGRIDIKSVFLMTLDSSNNIFIQQRNE